MGWELWDCYCREALRISFRTLTCWHLCLVTILQHTQLIWKSELKFRWLSVRFRFWELALESAWHSSDGCSYNVKVSALDQVKVCLSRGWYLGKGEERGAFSDTSCKYSLSFWCFGCFQSMVSLFQQLLVFSCFVFFQCSFWTQVKHKLRHENFIPVALHGRAVATLKIAVAPKSWCTQRCKFMLNYFEDYKPKKIKFMRSLGNLYLWKAVFLRLFFTVSWERCSYKASVREPAPSSWRSLCWLPERDSENWASKGCRNIPLMSKLLWEFCWVQCSVLCWVRIYYQ